MTESLLFGLIASSALPLGALAGGHLKIPRRVLAGFLAFAAGALADTLMPEAYEQGGPTVALSTAAGFLASFVLATL